jgi:putative transcriptional regulator
MDNDMAQFCDDLLQSVREMKAGSWVRKTEFITQPDGSIRRVISVDGTIEREELLTPVACTRFKSGLPQPQFAKLLGVSVRTLQEWEQGRRQPSGAAKTLLRIAEQQPDVLMTLATEKD